MCALMSNERAHIYIFVVIEVDMLLVKIMVILGS